MALPVLWGEFLWPRSKRKHAIINQGHPERSRGISLLGQHLRCLDFARHDALYGDRPYDLAQGFARVAPRYIHQRLNGCFQAALVAPAPLLTPKESPHKAGSAISI